MAQTLRSKAVKGFAWNFGGSILQQASTFIVSIFLARLLSPAEFGLVGMAMVFISVSQVFIDVGFASALIQRQDNTKLTYSSVFYLNVFCGFLLTLVFYFSAPLIGAFYKNDQISSLVRWLSLIFVFNSFDIVQLAILKKHLNFKIIAIRTFFGSVAGGVLGIIAAFLGFGVYSLVIQAISSAILSTILLWKTSQWRPDFKFSLREIKKLSGFSGYVFFDSIFSRVVQQLDLMMVGKIFSPAILGYFSRAVSLKNLVTTYSSSSLTSVFYPVLSSLQNNKTEYEKVYYKVTSLISFLSYGVTGVLCILGRDIILILFGEKWQPAVPIFQVIILMACNSPINIMNINAFLSNGLSKQNFWIGIFRKVLRLLLLLVMYFWGMFAYTVSFVILSYIITGINILFLDKYTGLSYKRQFSKVFEGMLPLAVVVIAFFYFDPQSLITRLYWALGFSLLYIGYSKSKKTEGYLFLENNLRAIIAKGKISNKFRHFNDNNK